MTVAAALGPLVAYAATFQTLVFLALPARLRTAWAPITIGVVGAGLTVAAGLLFGFDSIGLGPTDLVSVAVWALGTAVVVGLIGTTMLCFTRLRPTLADPRIARLERGRAVFQLAFRIPVMTALIEEAFFRGVLHAALTAAYSTPVAVIVGGGLFGIWHVGPALDQSNSWSQGRPTAAVHILLTVLTTTFAGFGFVGLRIVTGSIWVPAVVHALLNVIMAMCARIAARPRTASVLTSKFPYN